MGIQNGCKAILLAGVLLLTTATMSWAAEPYSPNKGIKRGGIRGSPAMKRGVELGWDKGYLAGKVEAQEGVAPDPSRHQDYNDPEKWYRYEFGNRTAFIRGFRGGFLKGYGHALQKKVRYKSPVKSDGSNYASTTGAAITIPQTDSSVIEGISRPKKAKVKKKKSKSTQSMVISDAL